MWKYICCQRPPGISPSFGCYGRRKADLWHLPRCSGIKCRPWWKSVSGYPIPDRTGISYRTPAAFYYNIPCHRVNITENTLLHSICHGETQIAVNSSHHQCVHIPAPGLVVSAVAPDGIIELLKSLITRISSWECSGIRNISGTEMRLLWDCFRHLWMRVNNISLLSKPQFSTDILQYDCFIHKLTFGFAH